MELTQIQWQNPGQKTAISWNNPIQIGSNPSAQIVHPNLDQNTAQIANWNSWVKTISPGTGPSPVIVNWQKIWWPTPINHWDTISVWKNNDVVLWVNKPWEGLSPWVVWKHLWNLNFSNEQIQEITKKLFDPNINETIKLPIYSLVWVLVFLAAWVIYWFFVFSDLNSQLASKSKKLDDKLAQVNLTIDNIEQALWIELDQWDEECYEDEEDCKWSSAQSIDAKISEMWKNFSSINNKINEADKKFSTLKIEVEKSITESLKWAWTNKLEDSIAKSLTDWPIKEVEIKVNEIGIDVDKLDKILWEIVQEIKNDVDEFSAYKEDLKALKEVRKFITDFDAEKALNNKKFILIENDIKNLKNDIIALDKKIDSLDTTLKTTNEMINSVDLKIRNLSN